MGMISEMIAEATVKKLELILLDAINGDDWSDNRIIIKGFSKKQLYQWYLFECGDAWINPNETIVKEFNKEIK